MVFWKRKAKKTRKKAAVKKKAAEKAKTAKKRPSNQKGRKPAGKKAAKKEDKFVVGFEEVKIICPSCGREFTIVKSSQFSTEGMLCQRCSAGGGIGLEQDDDF